MDWLIEKNRSGYKMVNSVKRLEDIGGPSWRGRVQCWDCRAGQNSIIIRSDGRSRHVFPTYGASYDWGNC